MNIITSYNTDFHIEHPFFGKARMASFEPVNNLCHSVAKDNNYTEAEEAQLIAIVHATISKFFDKYPKTRARMVRIQLSVGSSLESLRFVLEGYDCAGSLMYPVGNRLDAETDLFKQEYKQCLQELEPLKKENAQSFWTYCDQELPNPGERVVVLVAELEPGQSPDDPDAKRSYDIDYGTMLQDGSWETENDWDEGQPWGIVAWDSPYDASEANKHNVKWCNVQR